MVLRISSGISRARQDKSFEKVCFSIIHEMLFTLSVQQEPHVEPFLVVVYF